jgi:nucleotide-binding universal stress UspA family protein
MNTSLPLEPETETISAGAEQTFARLLVPVDFNAGSRRALATALFLRDRLGSEVHLFHLAEPGENDRFLAGVGGNAAKPSDLLADAKDRLARFVENLYPGRSKDVNVHARGGIDVVDAVRKTANDVGATLVLLAGTPKHTLFRTQLEKIARELDTPVMLINVPSEPTAS